MPGMKRRCVIGLVWAVALLVARGSGSTASPPAEENFSTAVRATDFSAAGLAKLSSEELARLDALVRDFKSGALVVAKRDAVAAEAARVAAATKAAKLEADSSALRAAAATAAKEKKNDAGILAKAKALLPAGTEVEFAATDSRIVGDFTGWEGKAIFTLENGQRWLVVNGGRYYTPPIASPKVKIVPAALGGFWMTIEGANQRVKVSPLGGGK